MFNYDNVVFVVSRFLCTFVPSVMQESLHISCPGKLLKRKQNQKTITQQYEHLTQIAHALLGMCPHGWLGYGSTKGPSRLCKPLHWQHQPFAGAHVCYRAIA